MPRIDADALPLLIEVMAAAGRHDGTGCLRLLDEAETHLPPGRQHKSRPDIAAARTAAAAGDWPAVYRLAWSATAGLTWAFPPDLTRCPPMPTEIPFTVPARCECGATPAVGAAFCHGCGTPTS